MQLEALNKLASYLYSSLPSCALGSGRLTRGSCLSDVLTFLKVD